MRCLRESILAHERKVIVLIAKVNSRCFLWYPAAILMYHGGTPIWRLHSELYKFPWNVLANNSRTLYRTDLRLGEVVYLLVFDNIKILGFFYRMVSNLFLYGVTVQPGNKHVIYLSFRGM